MVEGENLPFSWPSYVVIRQSPFLGLNSSLSLLVLLMTRLQPFWTIHNFHVLTLVSKSEKFHEIQLEWLISFPFHFQETKILYCSLLLSRHNQTLKLVWFSQYLVWYLTSIRTCLCQGYVNCLGFERKERIWNSLSLSDFVLLMNKLIIVFIR